jgi:alkanesulfonate monooxygenase SsuD/methylene tetrahydromethanopterin reductase-like flavin-dependent oxidoreductase (luciferase family)
MPALHLTSPAEVSKRRWAGEKRFMKIYIWDLLPYGKQFDEYKADRYLPWPLSGKHFDPEVAAQTYQDHLELWAEMDRLGYDGVGLNEHHTTPHGLMNSPNMMAAVAAQHTKRLKFLILGNLLPLHNPLRIAEELAMADCMSRGRVMAGFARGVPREYRVYDVPMAESRGRFEEAFDIVLKAWTEETFSHQGKYYNYKDIAIWPRPYQQPHPSCWVPFTGTKETIDWAGKHNVNAVLPHAPTGIVEDIVSYYAQSLARHGHRISPDRMIMLTDAWVAESKAEAIREYSPYYLYFNQTLWHHGSLEGPGAGTPNPASFDYFRPENRGKQILDRQSIRNMTLSDVERKVNVGEIAWGPPKQVAEMLIESAEQAGVNALLVNTGVGAMPHDLLLEQIRRFGREVLPLLQAHEVKRVTPADMVA